MDDQNKNQDQDQAEEQKPEEVVKGVEPSEPVAEAAIEADAEKIEEAKSVEESPVVEAKPEPEAEQKTEEVETKTEEPAEEKTEPREELSEEKEEKQKLKPASDMPKDAKWYIIHTYSGHENKVSKSLRQRVQSLGFETRIFDIIVPTRNTIKVSQGKKEKVKEKIFPGYVLVRMILDDESWLLVRTTQGVTAFIGAGNKPTPISEDEVIAIQKFMDTEEPLYKAAFTVGEAVKIVDGPFSDFLGTIDSIDEAKGKLKVLVSIFGRETPVELDFLQVNKL